MQLTNKQEEGLKIAVSRYKNHEPYTCIAGFSGSGKTTLVQYIVSALNLNPKDVAYIAYTGQAAEVLLSKGCPNAQTAHRLLYYCSFNETTQRLMCRPKPKSKINYKLIIVDEVSMLPEKMWSLLLSYGIPVIAIGDPAQLPPVASIDNKVLEHPHVFLDEVMRQAQESEIIRLTMDIRDGKPLKLFQGKEVRVLDQSDFVDGMLDWADQVLCAKNATRRKINQFMRDKRFPGETDYPQIGDKIICLKNDWQMLNTHKEPLVNGLTGYVTKTKIKQNVPFIKTKLWLDFTPKPEDPLSKYRKLNVDNQMFEKGTPLINEQNVSRIPKKFRPEQIFDYGYAITTHKAQGSEYSKVLVLAEKMHGIDYQRWLYTSATRAIDKLIIIKDF